MLFQKIQHGHSIFLMFFCISISQSKLTSPCNYWKLLKVSQVYRKCQPPKNYAFHGSVKGDEHRNNIQEKIHWRTINTNIPCRVDHNAHNMYGFHNMNTKREQNQEMKARNAKLATPCENCHKIL